jgi:ubiquinone/menaquinone biosynthesis C-methylase UbiE
VNIDDEKTGTEISRIRAEYARRDAVGLSRMYHYANPAFAFHMQEREWAVLRMFRDAGVNLAGARLLEVGCGTGHILGRFQEFGAGTTVGIDLADHRLRIARKQYPRLFFLHGNGAELPFADEAFDVVLQFMCLSSVLDPGTRKQIAAEMWRVVRSGGVILYYDLRPPTIAARLLSLPFSLAGNLFGKTVPSSGDGTATGETPPPTPIHSLTIGDIREYFPGGQIRCRSASLEFTLAGIAGASLLAAQLLSRIPFLRTHYLVLIRKPG